jgi:hypothetical protein
VEVTVCSMKKGSITLLFINPHHMFNFRLSCLCSSNE